MLLPFFRTIRLPKRPSPFITLYLLIVAGLAFTVALLPPTNWDSLSYHLRGPWLYLQAGRIYPGVDVFSLNNPFLLEMLFMLSMALRSDTSAQLIHFLFLFLLGGQVYLLAVYGLKLKDGWTAVLLLFTIPMVWQLAAFTYNDLALAFAILASFYTYLRWREGEQSRWLLLSRLFLRAGDEPEIHQLHRTHADWFAAHCRELAAAAPVGPPAAAVCGPGVGCRAALVY